MSEVEQLIELARDAARNERWIRFDAIAGHGQIAEALLREWKRERGLPTETETSPWVAALERNNDG